MATINRATLRSAVLKAAVAWELAAQALDGTTNPLARQQFMDAHHDLRDATSRLIGFEPASRKAKHDRR
jgi:hypothetical protein